MTTSAQIISATSPSFFLALGHLFFLLTHILDSQFPDDDIVQRRPGWCSVRDPHSSPFFGGFLTFGPGPPPPANLSKLRTDLISELGQPCQPGQSQTQEETNHSMLGKLKESIREGQ